MFSFGKSKQIANIVIDDYVIRIVKNNGKDFTSITTLAEKSIPQGTIQNGRIVDELLFYQFMKDIVQEWQLKHRLTRFNVPQELVIMRDIDIPNHIQKNEIKQYITMEIGNTIHFPFKNPVFDLYDLPQQAEINKVKILAAPEEEIIKYTQIFTDVSLKPIAVDVHVLGVYRYFLKQQNVLQNKKVYFILEINLLSANISIYHQHRVEFLRYQSLNIAQYDWEPSKEMPLHFIFNGDELRLQGEIDDLINELGRLMNFYRFSIHHGEKSITDLVILGDFPNLEQIGNKLKQRFDLPITILNVDEPIQNEQINRSFIPALGLALKGGK